MSAVCQQCLGKRWVLVAGRRVPCIGCILRETRNEPERRLIPPSEHRGDRPYDEQDASHLRHPNGSLVASFDRAFCGAAGRIVLDLYDLARPQTKETNAA